MNKVLQRIAIAESQGWKHDICNVGKHGTKMSGWWMPCGAFTTDINMLPDYCNDLNAMHEAETVMTDQQRTSYLDKLYEVCNPHSMLNDDWNLTCATAAQRAEAFLKTLNLWIP